MNKVSSVALVIAGLLSGCTVAGDDPGVGPSCTGGKCDGESPDAGSIADADGDAAPIGDAGPVSPGSVTIDGTLHTFATGHARSMTWGSSTVWNIDLDNWSYGSWGSHTEGISLFINVRAGSTLSPGTYSCGDDGPTTWRVSLDWFSSTGLLTTSLFPGASCTVTITSVPAAVGEPVTFTFAGTVTDENSSAQLVGGTGTSILRP